MHRPRERGFSLLEVMIAMSILLVGLLGMMRLQVWGMYSNQGARAQMQATQLARELVTAVGRVPFDDSRIGQTVAPVGSVLTTGGAIVTGVRDSTLLETLPGVRPDAALEHGPSGLVYRRFVTVQPIVDGTGATSTGAKLIGVSVVFTERGSPLPREVLMFVSRSNVAQLATNVASGLYN
jgi:prepilin-type N-terminal cleavage/methylation domain-containing protein